MSAYFIWNRKIESFDVSGSQLFKMRIKIFVKYYAEEFRQEDRETETFIIVILKLHRVYLPSCWGCVYFCTHCRYNRLTGRHTPGAAGHTSAVQETFSSQPHNCCKREAVWRVGRISHLLWANISQGGIFITNTLGRPWYIWWSQGWVVRRW